MKCYRMHKDLRIMPLVDAVTIYRGFAVCAEHLEELERSQFTASGEPYIVRAIDEFVRNAVVDSDGSTS